MNARSRSVLPLILIFGLLLGVYSFIFKDKQPPSDTPELSQDTVTLYSIDTNNVQSIDWTYNSAKATINRTGDTEWKLINPAIAGDSSKLTQFVSAIISLTGTNKYPFSEVAKKDVGLESPQFSATITLKDGSKHNVSIGNKTVDNSYYYVTAGSLDYSTLVSSYLVEGLLVDPYSLGPSPSVSPEASP